MKNILSFAAVVVMMGMSADAQARLIGHGNQNCGGSKCCDCAPTFQPVCCKPTIVRPCHRNIYNYQRSCAKPFCCSDPCANGGCCPVNGGGTACVDPNACCKTGPGCATACVDPNACCKTGPGCATTCVDPNACCKTGPGCATACVDPNACCHNGNACCPTSCDACCVVDNTECCRIAQLIYESQTACYARQRAAAIHKLGDRYDCVCHPEIMSAFIYALNDADERVRSKAADEIGDQIRRNHCCCTQCVVNALCVAMADCDRTVRREAEQALRLCGYHIVDGCCQRTKDCCVPTTMSCCNTGNGCVPNGCAPAATPAAPAAPAAPADAAPAPAPPAEPKAYFPGKVSSQPLSARRSLSNLFGLAN